LWLIVDPPSLSYGVAGEFFTEGNEGNKAGDFDLATFVIFASFC